MSLSKFFIQGFMRLNFFKKTSPGETPGKSLWPEKSFWPGSVLFLKNIFLMFFLPLLTFAFIILLWFSISKTIATDFPTPVETFQQGQAVLAEPFYDSGPNDKGIGWQILYSLTRVLSGFALAVLIGIPVGLLIGMFRFFYYAWNPLIQILRPVSPLAWLPIGLLLFKAVNPSAIFVIFITSIWPVIINTAAGVRAVPKDYLNVAQVLRLNPLQVALKILLPAILPYMITGMRLSLNIAWMVIVAAEMLTGGIGIGFYIWDEWNNLNVASIIIAIILIGMVGIILDSAMQMLQNLFSYEHK